MRSGHRTSALLFGAFSVLAVSVACSAGSRRILLPDGSYELKCEGPLSTCLLQMEKTCKDNGYDVIRATEKRDRVGPIEMQTDIVRSEGIVRCRRAHALFSPGAPEPAPVPTDVPPPLPEHAPLPPLHAPPASAAPPTSAAPPAPAAPPASAAPPAPAAAPASAAPAPSTVPPAAAP